MSEVNNVTAAKPKIGGSIYVAKVGTPLPTDAVSKLNDAFKGLGYISKDGVKNNNSPTTEQVEAWGGDIVLNTQTKKEDKIQYKLIEGLNIEVLKSVYGDENVSGDLDNGITVKVGSSELEDKSYVVEMVLKGGILKRIVIPQASLMELGEITYNDSDPIGYEITLTALRDSDGYSHYEYYKKKGE